MSSFLGHACTGAALFLAQSSVRAPATRIGLPVCVLLAIAPDLDYLAWWLLRVSFEPRWTHSLLFALATSGVAWLALRRASVVSAAVLIAAACSHMVLDLLVGVHDVPVLWPGPAWTSPVGLLPSAGRIDPSNYYFWRNLLIECGVLLPLLGLAIALGRAAPPRLILRGALLMLPLWLGAVVWSLHIH